MTARKAAAARPKGGGGGTPPTLKLVGGVVQAPSGRAANSVKALAPKKPQGVADSPELSTLWDEVVPQLDVTGLLTPADVGTVEIALRHLLAARKASDQVFKEGVMIGGAKEMKKHPAEAVFRLESAAYLEYAKQLAMTFMARARATAPESAGGDGDNPFASATG